MEIKFPVKRKRKTFKLNRSYVCVFKIERQPVFIKRKMHVWFLNLENQIWCYAYVYCSEGNHSIGHFWNLNLYHMISYRTKLNK